MNLILNELRNINIRVEEKILILIKISYVITHESRNDATHFTFQTLFVL